MHKKSLFKILLVVLATFFFTSLVSAAGFNYSGGFCGERQVMVDTLMTQFQEEYEDAYLKSEQELVELFVSDKGSWSIMVSRPDGISCVVQAGKGLHTVAKS